MGDKLDYRFVVPATSTQDGILKKGDYNKLFSGGSNGQVLTWNNGPTWGSINTDGFSAFSATNLTNPGYIKFKNGLIFQWGRVFLSHDSGPSSAVILPITYTLEIFNAHLTPNGIGWGGDEDGWAVRIDGLNQITCYTKLDHDSMYSWLTIGV